MPRLTGPGAADGACPPASPHRTQNVVTSEIPVSASSVRAMGKPCSWVPGTSGELWKHKKLQRRMGAGSTGPSPTLPQRGAARVRAHQIHTHTCAILGFSHAWVDEASTKIKASLAGPPLASVPPLPGGLPPPTEHSTWTLGLALPSLRTGGFGACPLG